MKSTAATAMPRRIDRSQLWGFFNPMAARLSPRNRNQNQMNTKQTHFANVETTMPTRQSSGSGIAFVPASSGKSTSAMTAISSRYSTRRIGELVIQGQSGETDDGVF